MEQKKAKDQDIERLRFSGLLTYGEGDVLLSEIETKGKDFDLSLERVLRRAKRLSSCYAGSGCSIFSFL